MADKKRVNNAVGLMQEYAIKLSESAPSYEDVGFEGPPHNRSFTIVATFRDKKYEGIGPSKKVARSIAANKIIDDVAEEVANINLDDPSTRRCVFTLACELASEKIANALLTGVISQIGGAVDLVKLCRNTTYDYGADLLIELWDMRKYDKSGFDTMIKHMRRWFTAAGVYPTVNEETITIEEMDEDDKDHPHNFVDAL
ncbi:VP11 [Liao ning virus]|uniref:VP11 n=1 Tax=Liao ning virus TaxID=246280 RepID=Q2TV09_9REOV|nr:VP11 [Liao ning virus]